MSGNNWTNFVKDWANKNNTTYMCAISMPELSVAYKIFKKDNKISAKKDGFQQLKDSVVGLTEQFAPEKAKRERGRPPKYAFIDERDEAKRQMSIASTKKIREKKKAAQIEKDLNSGLGKTYKQAIDLLKEVTRRAEANVKAGKVVNTYYDKNKDLIWKMSSLPARLRNKIFLETAEYWKYFDAITEDEAGVEASRKPTYNQRERFQILTPPEPKAKKDAEKERIRKLNEAREIDLFRELNENNIVTKFKRI